MVASVGVKWEGRTIGDVGQGPRNPDIAAAPDLASLTTLPRQRNIARFACDVWWEIDKYPTLFS